MRETTVFKIAQWCGGDLIQGVPSQTFTEISTDSRSLQGGELFLAIQGERFNGHHYLQQAVANGAAGLIVQGLPLETQQLSVPIIKVADTIKALQECARNYRATLEAPVVGITGSSGKTSTKDLIRSIALKRCQVNATKGNLNNHLGVPRTLLDSSDQDGMIVVEMGMNHPGEIEVLAEIAQPHAAIITNIGSAHIENLGSREAIASEKGMLAEAVPPEGFVVFPAGDALAASIAPRCRAKVLYGGVEEGDARAKNLVIRDQGVNFLLEWQGQVAEAYLPVPAEHMVRNATLAAAAALEWGLTLEEVVAGIADLSLTQGRLERREMGGLTFLDDSYNANPESMQAALKTLASLPVWGKRIAVLGAMAELGEFSEKEHLQVGQSAAEIGIDILVGIGEEGRLMVRGTGGRMDTHVFANQQEVAEFLRGNVSSKDLILLKGSRSAGMEEVLRYLT